jgi:hypothetical protein
LRLRSPERAIAKPGPDRKISAAQHAHMSTIEEVSMNNGGGDVRESELRVWRQEIRRMLSTGQRLSAVDHRLNRAALSETERFVLQAIARAEAKQSREVDSYRDGFGFIDG